MIKVAVVSSVNRGGVYKHRLEAPHRKLNSEGLADCTVFNRSVEDWTELKDFDLVYFHTELASGGKSELAIRNLRRKGIKVVMDIDDYWIPYQGHFRYHRFISNNEHKNIISLMKASDAVCCSTRYLAELVAKKIRKKTYVLPNSIDFSDPQFQKQPRPSITDNGRVYYGMVTGSSHSKDAELISGVANPLFAKYGDTVGTYLAGFNVDGNYNVNTYITDAIRLDMQSDGIFNIDILRAIANGKGKIKGVLPDKYVRKYGEVLPLTTSQRPIEPKDTVWYEYERILTANYETITDFDHYRHLHSFHKTPYDNGDLEHIRIWAKREDQYAKSYAGLDISIVPLIDNEFNRCKSNLKLLEAGAHSIPVVASDVIPYHNGSNGTFLVKEKRKKDWVKYISQLVENRDMRLEMGANLNKWVQENYNMDNTVKNRLATYQKILDAK